MELTPEERRRIYEEEKARIEAEERQSREKAPSAADTSVGLAPNIAGLLCYAGFLVTGIIFFILEQKNNWVRFHAAQSIVIFGTLWVAGMILGWIPFLGPVFSFVIIVTGFILWIVLMVKAYEGQRYKVIWAGALAERMVTPPSAATDTPRPATTAAPESREEPPAPTAPPAAVPADLDSRIARKIDEYFRQGKTGRIISSAFAIAWSIFLLVFFNFFHQYIAYYSADTSGRIIRWTRETLVTGDIHLWLPVLNTTLAVTIIGHIILLVFDHRLLRRLILLITACLGLATVITLLSIFPFDFSIIPLRNVEIGTEIGTRVLLVGLAIGFGIAVLVRLIHLLVDLIRGVPS